MTICIYCWLMTVSSCNSYLADIVWLVCVWKGKTLKRTRVSRLGSVWCWCFGPSWICYPNIVSMVPELADCLQDFYRTPVCHKIHKQTHNIHILLFFHYKFIDTVERNTIFDASICSRPYAQGHSESRGTHGTRREYTLNGLHLQNTSHTFILSVCFLGDWRKPENPENPI